MELRVIVIAAISLIIVSMSFVVHGRSPGMQDWSDAQVNLLEGGDNTLAGGRSGENNPLFSESTPTNLIDLQEDDERNAEFDRLEMNSDQGTKVELLEENEPLKPDANGRGDRSLSIPALAREIDQVPAVPSDPPQEDISPNANESTLLTADDQDPLATTWESAVSSDPIAADQTSEPVSVDDVALKPQPVVAVPDAPLESTPSPPAGETDPALEPELVQANSAAADSSSEKAEPAMKDIPASVAQIVRNHLQYGNTLARRGSLYSARQEFLTGLRLVIESLDLVNGVGTHREHYRLAITALNESEDFAGSSANEASLSVPQIAELHQSKILKDANDPSITPMSAMQTYYAYAQQHFSSACARSRVASEILFALGKLHTVKAMQDPSSQSTDLAIAILMHQAALNVDPRNYLSANELGVSLARLGHYESARAALLHSVATQPTPEAWFNLSVVHRALGETRLADLALAEQKAALAAHGSEGPLAQRIRWMAPGEFSAAQQVAYHEESAPANPAGTSETSQSTETDSRLWTKFKNSIGTR